MHSVTLLAIRQRLRSSVLLRASIGIPCIAGMYGGAFLAMNYVKRHFEDKTWNYGVWMLPLLAAGTGYGAAFIWHGFGTMAKLMGIGRYLQR